MKPLRPPHVPRKETHGSALEALVPEILAFLGADTERLTRFFDLTGLSPDGLRTAAVQTEFGASLIEYLAGDERLLRAFAAETGRDPAEIEALRQGLTWRTDDGG